MPAARWEPVPYVSALVGGCLESGKDANAGGARYGGEPMQQVDFLCEVLPRCQAAGLSIMRNNNLFPRRTPSSRKE